jgi:lysozyme family protein
MTPEVAYVIAKIQSDEGGVADLDDGKGTTYYGQTGDWLNRYGFPYPQSLAEAAQNWARWLEVMRFDAVIAWDVTVGHLVADWALHSGETPAVRSLQRAIGATPDGRMGPDTLTSLTGHNPSAIALHVLADRIEYVGGLLASHQQDRRKWAKGWLNRLARQVRALPVAQGEAS